MTDTEYKMIVRRMLNVFMDNQSLLAMALQEEYEKNINRINFDNVVKILGNFADVEADVTLEGKKMAVICKGDPETTIQILLASIRNNINIKLVTLNYHIINNCIFTVFYEILQDLRIPNVYVNYNENYFEQDIMERNKSFDKIIYIGSYFDYQNFEYFCDNENIVFWNDNNIKVLMDREKNKEDYKNMVKYAYTNNIELEVYEDEEEFFDELEEGEFAIIYTEDEEEKYLNRTNARIVRFNEFNIDDFKFNINDLILGLDFSVKV